MNHRQCRNVGQCTSKLCRGQPDHAETSRLAGAAALISASCGRLGEHMASSVCGQVNKKLTYVALKPVVLVNFIICPLLAGWSWYMQAKEFGPGLKESFKIQLHHNQTFKLHCRAVCSFPSQNHTVQANSPMGRCQGQGCLLSTLRRQVPSGIHLVSM
jgi:hypothetical protein